LKPRCRILEPALVIRDSNGRRKRQAVNRDIIVLGSLNVDFVVRVTRRQGEGETVPGSDFSIFPGGKGANQAVAASKLGAQCSYGPAE